MFDNVVKCKKVSFLAIDWRITRQAYQWAILPSLSMCHFTKSIYVGYFEPLSLQTANWNISLVMDVLWFTLIESG